MWTLDSGEGSMYCGCLKVMAWGVSLDCSGTDRRIVVDVISAVYSIRLVNQNFDFDFS